MIGTWALMKFRATDEMTALAEGAGPPENSMATFLFDLKSAMPRMVTDSPSAVKPGDQGSSRSLIAPNPDGSANPVRIARRLRAVPCGATRAQSNMPMNHRDLNHWITSFT